MPRKQISRYVSGANVDVARQYNFNGGLNNNDNENQIENNQLSRAENVRIGSTGEVTTRDGYELVDAQIGAAKGITGLGYYHKGDTVHKLIAKYNTDIYHYTDGGSWTALSQTLTAVADMEMVTAQDVAYITTGTDTFRKYDNSSVSTLTEIPVASATSSDQPRVLEYWSERAVLLLGNTTNQPQRLYFSDVDALETFRSLQFQDFDGPITGIKEYRDLVFVWTEHSTYILTGVRSAPGGNNNIAFEVDVRKMPAGVGCVAKRSPRVVNGFIYWAADDGIYRSEGSVVQYISSDVESTFQTGMVLKSNMCGGKKENRYYLGYTRSGQTIIDRAFVVDTTKSFPVVASIDNGYSPSVFAEMPVSSDFQLFFGDMTETNGSVYKAEVLNAGEESVVMTFETKAFDFDSTDLNKKLRKTFVRGADAGAITVSFGYKGTDNAGFTTQNITLQGNSATRGSSLTRGQFVRGFGGDVEQWIKTKLKSRTIKYQFTHTGTDEKITIYGLSPAFKKVVKLR